MSKKTLIKWEVEMEFMSKAECATLFGSNESTLINEILERVYNKAIEDTLKYLPEIITSLIVKTKGIETIFKKFEELNPELANKKQEIMQMVMEIEGENGALSLEEILEKVPERIKAIMREPEIPKDQPHTVEEVERISNGFI